MSNWGLRRQSKPDHVSYPYIASNSDWLFAISNSNFFSNWLNKLYKINTIKGDFTMHQTILERIYFLSYVCYGSNKNKNLSEKSDMIPCLKIWKNDIKFNCINIENIKAYVCNKWIKKGGDQ